MNIKHYYSIGPTICRIALLSVGILFSQNALAYKQSDMRKIAASTDTAVKMFLGYDSRTGQYKDQCIKQVAGRSTGQSPDAQSVFKMVSSMNEMTKDRQLDVNAAVAVTTGVVSVKGSVDLSFEEQVREKVESKAAYARFTDLAAPTFVSPNKKLQLNNTGEEAFTAFKQGKFGAFERDCGDSVILGFQKGREFRGVGNLSKSSSFKGKSRDIKTKLAARYMMAKMSASVSLSEQETNEAKNMEIDITYTASGDTRIRGATNFRQLRRAFVSFSDRPLSETQTYRFVYVIPYKDLLNPKDFDFGVSRQQLKKVTTIIDGIGALQSARNFARVEFRHGSASGANIDKNTIQKALKAFNRELSYLSGKMRESKGCLGKWNKSCQNMYARFSNFPSQNRDAWINDFMRTAYRKPATCNAGFIVTNPRGVQACRRCSVAKEPSFLNGGEGACRYIVKNKAKAKHQRLWAKDLLIKKASGGSDGGNAFDVYPDFCNKKGKGCGKKAATRLCKAQGLGEAKAWNKWNWKATNHIHGQPFRTRYANGKNCGENQNDFTPTKCRTFKYIDCGAGKPNKKAKGKKKLKANKGA